MDDAFKLQTVGRLYLENLQLQQLAQMLHEQLAGKDGHIASLQRELEARDATDKKE